jgi:EpsI family protein
VDRARFVEFPARIGDWQGHPSLLDLQTEKVLGVDDYILSDYRQSGGSPINLFVAYYGSQANSAPHPPSICIPAGGWKITDQREIRIVTTHGEGEPLNRVVIDKDGVKQLVYYWFDENGKQAANEYWAKFYRITSSILKNRTDAALIRFVTPIRSGESENNADERLQSFMQIALPQLNKFLPSSEAPAVGSAVLRASDPS